MADPLVYGTTTYRDSCFPPRGGPTLLSSLHVKRQFRILVMHLFMDDLSMEDVERFFFVYNLPARLRDVPGKLRSEVLTYIQHQDLVDQWSRDPSCLQDLLKELGRAELAAKVEEFMQSRTSLIQERQQFYHRTSLPVNLQITNPPSSPLSYASHGASCQDLSRDGGQPSSSSFPLTGTAQSNTKNGGETLSGSSTGTIDDCGSVARHREGGKELKARRRQQVVLAAQGICNWFDEENLLDKNTNDLLKTRVSFTTSEATSSGYWSTRTSGARFSQLSVANSDTTECGDTVASCESDDCGSILDLDWTTDVIGCLGNKDQVSSVLSSTNPVLSLCDRLRPSPAAAPGMGYRQDISGNESSPYPMATFNYHGDELCRVSANKNNCRDGALKQGVSPPVHFNQTNSRNGDELISGELWIKSKTLLKAIDKNSQKPFTSTEFPTLKNYEGPLFEMRLHATSFGKDSVSLYVDLAKINLLHKATSEDIEIPAMDVTVKLYKCCCDGGDKGSKREITSVSARKEGWRINCSKKTKEGAVLFSFPKLIGHRDLNLSKDEPHSALLITMEMKMDGVF